MGQESWSSQTGALTGCNQAVRQSHSHAIRRLLLGRIRFQPHSGGCWQASEDPLPSFYVSLSEGCLTRWLLASRRGSNPSSSKGESSGCQSFYSIIPKVTSHPFSCILFVRSELLGPVSLKKKRLRKGRSMRSQGPVGPFQRLPITIPEYGDHDVNSI